MEPSEAGRTRLLVSSAQSAGLWALGRMSQWLWLARTRLSALEPRLEQQVPPRVQRFGKGLWQRVTARFPALAELLGEPLAPTAAAPYTRAPAQPNGSVSSEDAGALIAALRDPSAEAAAVAALKLGAHSAPEALPALQAVLENADGYFNPLVRVAALQAFAHRLPSAPDADQLAPLVPLVRDIDAEVSMAAIDAIAQRAAANVAIEHLLPVVLDDSGFFLPIVRAAATRALERAGLMTTASA